MDRAGREPGAGPSPIATCAKVLVVSTADAVLPTMAAPPPLAVAAGIGLGHSRTGWGRDPREPLQMVCALTPSKGLHSVMTSFTQFNKGAPGHLSLFGSRSATLNADTNRPQCDRDRPLSDSIAIRTTWTCLDFYYSPPPKAGHSQVIFLHNSELQQALGPCFTK